MTRWSTTVIRSTLALVASVGLAASIVNAEPPADPLKGPKVEPRNVPGDHGQFGDGRKDRKAATPEIPHQAFMRMINATLGDQAPADLKLSDDQKAKIKSLSEDFEKKARDYRQQHANEFADMQKDMGGRPGAKPGKPGKDGEKAKRPDAAPPTEMAPEMTPEQREKLAEKYRELRANAPKPEDARTAIWAQLNDAQKKAVQAKIDAFRDEAIKRRADAETKKKLNKNDGKDGKDGAANPKREEIRKKLEGMTPEEREKYLAELRKRRQNQQPGEPKPAPTEPKP